MSEEAKGKSVIRLSEWKLEGDPAKGFQCVKYTTETVDGAEGQAKAERTVAVPRPDLTGADLEPAFRLCARFGFTVTDMIDSCRAAEYTRVARAWLSDVIANEPIQPPEV